MDKKGQDQSQNFNDKFLFEEDITHPNTNTVKIYKKEKILKESKDASINNTNSNRTPTNYISKELQTFLNLKDKKKDEFAKNNINKNMRDKKFEIIKKDPIITQVTMTKFYPRKNIKNRTINEFEVEKNDYNLNKKKNRYCSGKILKKTECKESGFLTNKSKNSANDLNDPNKYEKLLNKYKNLLKDINNKEKNENKEMNLKFNYEGYLNDIKQSNKKKQTKSVIYENKNDNNKDIMFKTQLKQDINEAQFNKEISQSYRKGFGNYLQKMETIKDEDNHLQEQNELLNKEIKRLQEYIKEQERYVQNYKNKQKINEEQIKYLLTLKESNIISHKEKDCLIEEMKNKIFVLEKENDDLKEEIKSLNKIIELNKKEKNNSKIEKNNNEKILREIKGLKKLLSEKNDIIETLQPKTHKATGP